MLPPRLSGRSRRKAGENAVKARQERAKVKEMITNGEIFFFDLFGDERKSVKRMKMIDLLTAVPGIGKTRAELIIGRTGISPSRRIGGVGKRQLELLRQEFLLVKNSRKPGKLLVVSGPSGVGKSTITNQLRTDDRFWISISVTTRKIRTGETNAVDYHFVSDEHFAKMVDKNEFLEWADFAGARYGTPKQFVDEHLNNGKSVLLELEISGARQVRAKNPEALLVFLAPPSWEELEERLFKRGTDTEERRAARLALARAEMAAQGEFDLTLINTSVEEVAKRLISLALA